MGRLLEKMQKQWDDLFYGRSIYICPVTKAILRFIRFIKMILLTWLTAGMPVGRGTLATTSAAKQVAGKGPAWSIRRPFKGLVTSQSNRLA